MSDEQQRTFQLEIGRLQDENERLRKQLADSQQCGRELAAKLVQMQQRINTLQEQVAEHDELMTLQHKRMREADQLWQQANGKPDVWPDLGDLLAWLMQERRELAAAFEDVIAKHGGY